MPTRDEGDKTTSRNEVYDAIDSERDYQNSLWESGEMKNKTIGDWNTVLRVYLRRAEDAWTYDSDENVLDFIRKIAATGVHSMEQLGVVPRATSWQGSILSKGDRKFVYYAINKEREYQDSLWKDLDDRNSVGDFLTYMWNLSRESDQVSNPDTPESSLDIIRKLTAVAVACMERFGAPIRRSK